MSDKRYIARAPNVAARMIGGEMMIMSGRDSSLFSLNATASALWQAADGVTPLARASSSSASAPRSRSTPPMALRDAEELAADLARPRHPAPIRFADARAPRRRERHEHLMHEMGAKALKLGIPLGVQLDLTYRCNERCVHCYLDHDDHGEMTTAGDQGPARPAGRRRRVLPHALRRRDLHAQRPLRDRRARAASSLFSVKLKTNAVMIRKAKAERIARARRRVGADQRLLAQGGGARRDHQAAGILPAHDRGRRGCSRPRA